MADSSYEFKEVRFYIEPGITHCYVFLQAYGDSPIGVQGWHKKSFPESKTIADIIHSFPSDQPVLWGQEAPPK